MLLCVVVFTLFLWELSTNNWSALLRLALFVGVLIAAVLKNGLYSRQVLQ